ncbi:MAG: hypothetical protein AAFX51_16755 [Cyanobacteria bacterium J06636_28]
MEPELTIQVEVVMQIAAGFSATLDGISVVKQVFAERPITLSGE